MMKRMLLMLLALALAVPCIGSAEESGAADLSRLNAVEMTRLMGNGINLGNTMEACNNGARAGNTTDNPSYYETMWGQPVTTAEMLREMKAAGFDTVRIPVAWITNATHVATDGDPTISPAYLDRVAEIVDYALDADMFAIVNDHWDGGWWGMFGSDTEAKQQLAMDTYIRMWQQIAERFAGYDDRLIFESANEELGDGLDKNSPLFTDDSLAHKLPENECYALTNRINQTFVDTVRAAGGNNAHRFLLIAGYNTNIDKTFDSRFQMPTDSAENRLMVSVHFYDPWSYCGAPDAKSATAWGKQKDFETMYSTLSRMKKFTAEGYGVVIGEYGALPGADGVMKENAAAYHKAFLDCCDALDFTSCLWDCSGFFIRRKLQMTNDEMAAVYSGRNAASEAGKDYAEIAKAGKEALDAVIADAPEILASTGIAPAADKAVGWIMFSEAGWGMSYSVGDTYNPDSITRGIIPADAEIKGAGTYTVSLDFTGTEKGYAANMEFSAVGISNGEILFPEYCIRIVSLKVNGETVKLQGRDYTCSDDGTCTRTNLYNPWVDGKNDRARARVMIGDLTGISAQVINPQMECMNRIETIEVTFEYGPHR